jgi:hypothetical protein
MERKPRVEVRCKEKHGSPTAVKRHVAATMAVFWLPACVRAKGLVRSLAPIDRLSLPITATSAGLLPDRGAWDRLHHSISLPKTKRLPFPADVHCRLDSGVECLGASHRVHPGCATMDE